ncbi:MAG: sigma-70 family RNA polymerase sigma factor [Lachnospiraceae bacterium]|nr:sigma-70 family RNA polymerase sigma factor [Lachnospiraceae bacterium]
MENFEADVALVEQAKKGDKTALEELCKSSMRSVYYVALKILKNEADAEDIMSDTMVTVVEKISSLSEPAAYMSWVNRIAVNKCKNYLAKNKPIYLGEEEQEVLEHAELENYNEEFLPEEFVLSKEKNAALMEVLREKTTAAEMMSILMFYYNNDSIKTIASEMNCAEITVKKRLASARKKMKDGLEEKFGKGVLFMATTGLFVLGKALRAEAAEIVVPEAAAEAAVTAGLATVTPVAETAGTANVGAVAMGEAGKEIGKQIAKKAGKEMAKKALTGKIIAGIVGVAAVAGIAIGVATMGKNSGESGTGDVVQESGKEIVTENNMNEDETVSGEIAEVQKPIETYLPICSKNGVLYFANENEEVIQFTKFESVGKEIFHNVTFAYDEDGNQMLIDINQNLITEPGLYYDIDRNNEEQFCVRNEEGQYGVIDYTGRTVIPMEYSRMNYITDNEGVLGCYVAEKKDTGEYFIITTEGNIALKTTEEVDKYLIKMERAHTSDSVATLYYEGTLYNLNTGEELLSGLESGRYLQHLYFEGESVTVYDATFQEKTTLNDFEYFSQSVNEDGRIEIRARGNSYWYLSEDYELTEIVEEDYEEIVLANGKKYRGVIDKEAKLAHIYEESGEEYMSISFAGSTVYHVGAAGNFFTVAGRLHDAITGEMLIERGDGYRDNERNELVETSLGSGSYLREMVVGNGFVLTFEGEHDFMMHKNGFWCYDRDEKVAYSYDLNGNLLQEISGIEKVMTCPYEYFILMVEEGKSKVCSYEDGSILWEVDFTTESSGYFPYSFSADNIAIIQLSDGLYNLNGERLVEFKESDQ